MKVTYKILREILKCLLSIWLIIYLISTHSFLIWSYEFVVSEKSLRSLLQVACVCTCPIWSSAVNSTDADWSFIYIKTKSVLVRCSSLLSRQPGELTCWEQRNIAKNARRGACVHKEPIHARKVSYFPRTSCGIYFKKYAEKCSRLSFSATKFSE